MKIRALSSKIRALSGNERGAILVFSSILIVVLLGFAALTVDLGAAWSQRRQNQTAVDAAVMAGGLNVISGGGRSDLVIAKVQEFANKNLDPDVTAADWTACTDAEVDGVNFMALDSSVTECISISGTTSNGARILRVKLPTRNVDTLFAPIIGINTIPTSAFAEAELDFGLGGGALPFVVPTGSDVEYCIGDAPAGLANDPCDGPQRAKFGDFDSPFYGTTDPGTAACPGPPYPNLITRLEWNVALGLDHRVFKAGGDDSDPLWKPSDGADTCDAKTVGYFPYALVLGNGNPGPASLTAGFAGDGLYGTAALLPGRLRQGGGLNGAAVGATLGATDVARPVPEGNGVIYIDNVGLWEYLTDTGTPTDMCDKNNAAYAADGPTATAKLKTCLNTGSPVFIDDIVTSPRFAFIPRLWLDEAQLETALPGTPHNIKEFVPVYVQRTFWNCSSGTCMAFETFEDLTPGDPSDDPQFFAPGEGIPEGCLMQGIGCRNNVNLSLSGVTAWILNYDDVPADAFGGGSDEDEPIFVRLFR